MSYHWLFSGTAIGFVASALLVVSTVLPRPAPVEQAGGIYDKTTRGARIYLKTPRLLARPSPDPGRSGFGSASQIAAPRRKRRRPRRWSARGGVGARRGRGGRRRIRVVAELERLTAGARPPRRPWTKARTLVEGGAPPVGHLRGDEGGQPA